MNPMSPLTLGRRLFFLVGLAAMVGCDAAQPDFSARETELSNGMRLIVIPDRRWPVATHMVWYRVGAGDEQKNKTGLAHFLEHLMFKDEEHQQKGGFTKIVSRHGGRDNAFTSYDYTAYFQRIHRDKLELVMQLEASRARGIKISEDAAAKERDVVIEELHSRLSTNPQSVLRQKMRAALYSPAHPYGRDIIGYEKDIKTLTAKDALDFHHQHYDPSQAVIVLAGDIGFDEAEQLAEKYYGDLKPAKDEPLKPHGDFPPVIKRWSDKAHLIHRNRNVSQAIFSRIYANTNRHVLGARQSAGFEVLTEILAGGQRSRLYRALVIEQKIASFAGAYLSIDGRGPGEFSLRAALAPRQKQNLKNLRKIEKSIDRILSDLNKNPISEAELMRAKNRLIADAVYINDSQYRLANFIGRMITNGHRLDEITTLSSYIRAVTINDVRQAAKYMLNPSRAINGFLLPEKTK